MLEISPNNIDIEKIKFICNREEDRNFYEEYYKNKNSEIMDNSIQALNLYSQMLCSTKDKEVIDK